MFAIVTVRNDSKNIRRLNEYELGKAIIIEMGQRTGQRQLNKVLKNFNGDVILGANTNRLNVKTYNTLLFNAELLYFQFAEKILSLNGRNLKIGILDNDFLITNCQITTRLITHTASLLICTDKNIDLHLEDWLIKTGICPEVTDNLRLLSECDFVFSPFKSCPYSTAIFGVGGVGIDNNKVEYYLPENYRCLLNTGVNAADLLCMLCREKEAEIPFLEKSITQINQSL